MHLGVRVVLQRRVINQCLLTDKRIHRENEFMFTPNFLKKKKNFHLLNCIMLNENNSLVTSSLRVSVLEMAHNMALSSVAASSGWKHTLSFLHFFLFSYSHTR